VTTVLTGTIGAWTCTSSTCTATYTAPAAVGTDTVSVKLAGLHTLGSPFAIRAQPGVATKLAFTTQPSASTTVNVVFARQPVVTVQDFFGNTVTGSTAAIALTLTTGNAALVGNATVSAVAGVATFAGLKITPGTGANYVLTAATTGLTSATTAAFTIVP